MEFRRFAVKAALFLGIVVALLGALEPVARAVFNVKERTWTAAKLRWESERIGGVEVAVFGTSHPYLGINPADLSLPGFNFANIAQDLYYGDLLFERRLPEMPRLKAVIIGIDPFTFGLDETKVNLDRVLPYLAAGYPPRRVLSPVEWLKCWSWLVRYRTMFLETTMQWLRGRLDDGWSVTDSDRPPPGFRGTEILLGNGFVASTRTMTSDEMAAYGPPRARFFNADYDSGLRPENRSILCRWIRAARARGVKVLLVALPAWPDYDDRLSPAMHAECGDDLKAVLAACGGPDVAYHSYRRDPRFDLQDFTDGDHLNASGAGKLAGILEADLAALLAGPPPYQGRQPTGRRDAPDQQQPGRNP